MKQKVVIIGIGFTSRLGLIRSLAELDLEINVIIISSRQLKPIDCYSKYVNNYYYCRMNDKKELIRIIIENCIDWQRKVILIPANDFAATVIDENTNMLKEHFLFPNIDYTQGLITVWMNKEKQKEAVKKVGVNVVSSHNIEIINGDYSIPADIKYPCFTKTRSYVSGYKSTLHRCNDKKELYEVLSSLSKEFKKLMIMVEDYKKIEKEYAIVGFSNGKEVVVPGVIEILLMAEGNDMGVACKGKIISTDDFEALVDKFKKFILQIGFVGLFDVDFYKSEGQLYFSELNLRIGGSASAILKMGINLPFMLVKTFMGESIADMPKKINRTATFCNERICTESWSSGHLSTKDYYDIMESSDISFVKDKEDWLPEIVFYLYMVKNGFKRMLKVLHVLK